MMLIKGGYRSMESEFKSGYKIGSGIGTLLFKIVFGLFKLLWSGIVTASKKNKILLITYVCLFITTLVLLAAEIDCSFVLVIIFIIAIISGIWQYKKEYPIKKRRQYFNSVFEEVGLQKNDTLPYYVCEDDVSDYVTVYSFQTLVPLKEWYAKKDIMEMYFNEKIWTIQQRKNDNRLIDVIVQKEPLPDYIEWDDEYIDESNDVLNIGIGYLGIVGMNLEKYPHGFVAGETGSGKSNILKCLIYQALVKNYDVILIDFKRGVSFSSFSDIVKIYYEHIPAMQILTDMVKETKRRLDLFRMYKVDNLNDYNEIQTVKLHRKIIFIDELAELLKVRDKELSNILYDSIETLTRLSRAVGIHLIMGIQRPDSTIINGQIKNNVSYRVCGRFVDKEPSRIMLSNDMASKLANIKGRFIVKSNSLQEIQSFYYEANYTYIEPEKEEDVINNSDNEIEPDTTPLNEPVGDLKEKNDIDVSKEINFDFSDIEK